MKFLSIKEFFYKLNTIGFILLLLPLSVFIFLYYQSTGSEQLIETEDAINGLLACAFLIFIIVLTTVNWIGRIRLKRLKALLELARKMDGYAGIFLLRMAAYSACSLLTASGFYLTRSILFAGLFMFIVFMTFLQWPSRSSFCRQLEVNPNEREMIMKNGDTIAMRGGRKKR